MFPCSNSIPGSGTPPPPSKEIFNSRGSPIQKCQENRINVKKPYGLRCQFLSFVYVRSTILIGLLSSLQFRAGRGPPLKLVVVPLSIWSQSPKLSQAVTNPQSFVYVRSTLLIELLSGDIAELVVVHILKLVPVPQFGEHF